jgi:predicted esterase
MLRTRHDVLIAGVLVVMLAAYGITLIMDNGRTEEPASQISQEHLHTLIVDGNWSDALMVAQQLSGEDPTNPTYHKALTRIHAILGDSDAAIESLADAVENGFDDYLWIACTPYLEDLRKDPASHELIRGAHRNLEPKVTAQQEEKTIHLREGEGTEIRLECEEYEYPNISLTLSFDTASLTINATVNDLHFNDGERSWRYGDGFFINFALPDADDVIDADRYYGLGFSLERGAPIGILVSRNGVTYFDDVQPPRIVVDEEAHTADYSITLPWTLLRPFRPLLDEKAGINIIYTSLENETTKRIMWMGDPHYDGEYTDRRIFAPLYFETSEKSRLQFVGELSSRLLTQPKANVTCIIFTPIAMSTTLNMTVNDRMGRVVSEFSRRLSLNKGKNLLVEELNLANCTEGSYKFKAILNGSLSWNERFFVYDEGRVSVIKETADGLDGEPDDLLLQSSVSALKYRISLLEDTMNGYHYREDPHPIAAMLEELNSSIAEIEEHGSIYHGSGYVLSAFESPIDGSLQPYSLLLPPGFDPDSEYDLVVMLHGSGVDEVDSLYEAQSNFNARTCVILGPRGRGLSDFWVGDTETDSIHVIETVQRMFNVDRTLLGGFSMGGYGSWRFFLRHPELFDAVAVLSGMPYNPRVNLPEYDMRDKTGSGKDKPIFVAHGTEDQSIPIEYTDSFVRQLEDEGYDVTYLRIEGAGHADYSIGAQVYSWLNENFR